LERFRRLRRRSIRNSPAPSGGSVDHNDLRGSIPATAFTMSIQFHQHPPAMLSSVDLGGARIRVLAGDACGSTPIGNRVSRGGSVAHRIRSPRRYRDPLP
jgi:hypothetical protein